ncbi:hypothetical protein [Sandaracinus amylolyticus]|uniref:hypothetical protein n=1 Tax=Sandaracinus amylolyticus TaxID=927083 RepID=UPI001F388418|nr:hypothetical protein [Sandaracinus amylolyticus]UJR82399.1 Hypothetical protein I5071_44640 [Sandaracinus amylolyticus]
MRRRREPGRGPGFDGRAPSANGSEIGAALGHLLAVGAAAALTTMSRDQPARALAIVAFLVGWALVAHAESRVEVQRRPLPRDASKEIPRCPNDRYH